MRNPDNTFSLPLGGFFRAIWLLVRKGLALRPGELWLRRKLRFPRTASWRHNAMECAQEKAVIKLVSSEPGVNIYGFLSGEFGLGESVRQYVRALIAQSVPVSLHDLDIPIPHSRTNREYAASYDTLAPHPITLFFVNPDCLGAALASVSDAELEGKYLMACWFWELGRAPQSWLPSLTLIDELMVASTFNEEMFKSVSSTPVFRVPVPLTPSNPANLKRSDFGLDDTSFIFLCTFDFNSWMERKNPLGVIKAFTHAFPDGIESALLLIKTTNGFRHPEALRCLLRAAEGNPRVIVRDDLVSKSELAALQMCCDAYVSLHRSEGFGLGMAEAMILGKPVIATAWSGNMDFMNAENSCLVQYRLVEVEEGQYVETDGQFWAEPDISDAARWMRRLASDRKFAKELGARAAGDVSRTLSPAVVGLAVGRRLSQICDRSVELRMKGKVA